MSDQLSPRCEADLLKDPPWDPSATELGKAAVRAFRRDIRALLQERPGQWVAYYGDQPIAFAATDRELYRECLRRGLPESDFIIRPIEPVGPDEVFIW
jgi:hypothetical protein